MKFFQHLLLLGFLLLSEKFHLSHSLVCYDCLQCPYPWSSVGVGTYGSMLSFASRVKACYKKEFYSAIDRRLDRVVRGALDGPCRAGKLETIDERSITYCCYSNYYDQFPIRMNTSEDQRTNQTHGPWTYSFMHWFQLIYIFCLCLFGIAGNLLCAIVFTTKSLRRIRSSSFLFVLALSDALLLLDLLPGWINTNFGRSLYHDARFICQIEIYISFVTPYIHIWMVLAFTAERCFAVNFPLKHMSQCNTNLVRTLILLLVIPACLFYIYPPFFASKVDEYGLCREKDSHVRYLTYINTIDTIMTMFLPFLVVSVLNILIIRKLFCSNDFREHVFENGSSYQYHPSPTRVIKKEETHLIHETGTSTTVTTTNNVSIKRKYHQRHVLTEVRLTKMLLAISLTCLLLNFPSYYLRLLGFYEKSKKKSNAAEPSGWLLYREIFFHYMSYLSYGINIVIYILFGANFRRALKRVFCSRKHYPWDFRREMSPFRYSFGEMTTSMNQSFRRHHPLSPTCHQACSSSHESFVPQASSENTGQ